MTTRQPYYLWKVAEREFKLKLTTANIVDLEKEYGGNLLTLLNNVPSLSVMLNIVTKAMQKFHHGVGKNEVAAIYDDYVDAGGSQLEFFKDVVLGIFGVSGFFSVKMEETMQEQLETTEL